MITFHVERFEERLSELQALLPMHYEELALNKDKVPLAPQYEVYIERERQGALLFVTAREAGELVGYLIAFIAPGLHYKTCLTCITDIFYVRQDKRGSRAGVRLMQFVESELKRRGVQRWFIGSKKHKDASSLFEYMGMDAVETTHSKWLGD